MVEKFTAAFTEKCLIIVVDFFKTFTACVCWWCAWVLRIGYVRLIGHVRIIVIARWHRLMLHGKV